MGTLQKYLLGVVDDAGCKPYRCGNNADLIRMGNSYLAWPPQPLLDRGAITRGFFKCSDSEKGPARERFFVFHCPLRSSQNQAVLVAGLEGTGIRVRDFQHYAYS